MMLGVVNPGSWFNDCWERLGAFPLCLGETSRGQLKL